ncbi:MAG: AbrB family transcriptional regulator, partial [Leptolyngbyaceae cyanobacterium]
MAVSQVTSDYSGTSPTSTATEPSFPHSSGATSSAVVTVLPLQVSPSQSGLPAEQPRWPSIQLVLTLLPLSVLASLSLMAIGAPVGWLLGAMLVGIAYVIKQGKTQVLFPGAAAIGQVIIALATADRFSLDTLTLARTYALPLMLCILTTGSLSVLNGYLLSHWVGIDRKTSLLGCIPGAGPSIVALSEEMGADTLIVAVLQYVRILLVSAVIPILANLFFVAPASLPSQPSITTVQQSTMPTVINLLVLAGCGYLGNWAGRHLKLPSGGFLGPFLVGLVAFWGVPHTFHMPQIVFIAGLLLVGLSIGLKFDWHTVRRLF